MPEPVVIVEYDARWPGLFEALRDQLVAGVGDLVVTIEHIGSTSVPGLAAKPIIDLDLVVPSVADIPVAIERLATLGYVHRGDQGVPGREAFRSPPQKPRHHLYVCPLGGDELRRHVAFRDHLRGHPEDARAYAELKKAAALRFRDDRLAYVEAKGPFVEEISRRVCRA